MNHAIDTQLSNSSASRNPIVGVGGAGINILQAWKLQAKIKAANQMYAADGDLCDNRHLLNFPVEERLLFAQRDDVAKPYCHHYPTTHHSIQDMLLHGLLPKEVMRHFEFLLTHADSLAVLAGLGGYTGSLVGPCLVNLAAERGITVTGYWVTPFAFENKRLQLSEWIMQNEILKKNSTNYFFNNTELAKSLFGSHANSTTMSHFYRQANMQIAKQIKSS